MPPSERSLPLAHGTIHLPSFLPDATFGVVRGVDAVDLADCGVQCLMMNTFHLLQNPGSSTIQALGGVHAMSGWKGPIFTDSGGFQIYSLIHQDARFGKLSERGLTFRMEGAGRNYQLTPEKSIQLQMAYGADVVICLDDCTHVDAVYEEQRSSVERTISWAKRGRAEYDRLLSQKNLPEEQRPKIFAVIQGGGVHDLRQRCAESLLQIGFDGYGYGGWPLDGAGNLLEDILAYVRQLIPNPFPLHALGVGHPYNVLISYRLGYALFDSAMPTRDARHGRLYSFKYSPHKVLKTSDLDWLSYIYIHDKRHIKKNEPLSSYCDCLCCRQYSLGYLHHLFKINDSLYMRLATLHNLRFMTQLMEQLRE
jgi:queuine tRNA-ribosyltransferase